MCFLVFPAFLVFFFGVSAGLPVVVIGVARRSFICRGRPCFVFLLGSLLFSIVGFWLLWESCLVPFFVVGLSFGCFFLVCTFGWFYVSFCISVCRQWIRTAGNYVG